VPPADGACAIFCLPTGEHHFTTGTSLHVCVVIGVGSPQKDNLLSNKHENCVGKLKGTQPTLHRLHVNRWFYHNYSKFYF